MTLKLSFESNYEHGPIVRRQFCMQNLSPAHTPAWQFFYDGGKSAFKGRCKRQYLRVRPMASQISVRAHVEVVDKEPRPSKIPAPQTEKPRHVYHEHKFILKFILSERRSARLEALNSERGEYVKIIAKQNMPQKGYFQSINSRRKRMSTKRQEERHNCSIRRENV